MDILIGLKKAILANVASPKKAELKKYEFAKMLPSSPSLEGNYEIGVILFVGVADFLGISREEVEMFLSIEEDEYDWKLKEYGTRFVGDKRFFNKVNLIINYLQHYELV